MRALFAGEEVDHDGLVTVDRARLWTLPAEPPPLIGAAVSAETAALGRRAGPTGWSRSTSRATRSSGCSPPSASGGGEGKPVYLQVHVSWAPTERGGARHRPRPVAHQRLRAAGLLGPRDWSSTSTRPPRFVRPEDVRDGVLVSADLGAARAPGSRSSSSSASTAIYLHHVGQEQRAVHRRVRRARAPGAAMSAQGHQRPVVEERGRLLPRRPDVPRLRRRRHRRLRRADRADRLPRRARRHVHLADAVLPPPRKDDGYDITDYYGVDPRLGTFGDFAEFVRTARDRGMRVIADLVVNHTSDQHPWFQAARADPDSPLPRLLRLARREAAGEARRRRLPRQGGLQLGLGRGGRPVLPAPLLPPPARPQRRQPEVRDEIAQVIGFWLEQGLSGFRVDAVPFLLEPRACRAARWLDPHELPARPARASSAAAAARRSCSARSTCRPTDQRTFFGDEDGDELHMLFDFTGHAGDCTSRSRASDAAPLEQALRRAARDPARLPVGDASCATTTS